MIDSIHQRVPLKIFIFCIIQENIEILHSRVNDKDYDALDFDLICDDIITSATADLIPKPQLQDKPTQKKTELTTPLCPQKIPLMKKKSNAKPIESRPITVLNRRTPSIKTPWEKCIVTRLLPKDPPKVAMIIPPPDLICLESQETDDMSPYSSGGRLWSSQVNEFLDRLKDKTAIPGSDTKPSLKRKEALQTWKELSGHTEESLCKVLRSELPRSRSHIRFILVNILDSIAQNPELSKCSLSIKELLDVTVIYFSTERSVLQG
eukprot:TRINITY_DN22994_c0_g1_i1.p1 TRINITY_DN22994_c0_g1~~TRINITY_DN22994_c0_g1_i1.p1  ORF type:complete len:264 (+),score=44.12 TRINITY_DN22994_c0_g1_i1:181-972(+)